VEVRTNGVSVKDFAPHVFTDRETGLYMPGDEPLYKPQVSNGYSPYDFPVNGLVLYLPLWALKGSPIKSVDAYRHVCTVTGALWRPNGRLFGAGVDVINLGNPAVLSLGSTWTIQAWFKSTDKSGGQGALITKDDIDKRDFYAILGSDGLFNFAHYIGTVRQRMFSTVEVDDDVWHNVAFTNDGTHLYINTDGTVDTGADLGGNTDALGADFCVGNWALNIATNAFGGAIGEVTVYNRALYVAETTYNRNTTKWRYQ